MNDNAQGEGDTPDQRQPMIPIPAWFTFAWQILLVIVIATATRVTQLDRPLGIDELFSYLAAESYADSGTFAILDGAYTRAPAFTALVATLFDWFGVSPTVARLPGLVAGIALVASIFIWARRWLSTDIAVVATVFALFWQFGAYMSQTVRYYEIQSLFLFNASFLILELSRPGIRAARAAGISIIVCLLFLGALYLQNISVIPIALALGWLAGALALRHLDWLNRNRVVLVSVGGLCAAGILAGILSTDLLDDAVRTYGFAPPWTALRDNLYYLVRLRDLYPSFLPIALLALLPMAVRYPNVASMAFLCVAGTITFHSFAGTKDPRYVHSATPFLFLIFATTTILLSRVVAASMTDLANRFRGSSGVVWMLRFGAAFGVAFLVLLNPAFKDSIIWMRADERAATDRFWADADDFVTPHRADGFVIVTDADVETVHHIGDFDIHFSPSALFLLAWLDDGTQVPFYPDFRTGRFTIGDVASIRTLLACHGKVAVVARRDLFRPESDGARELDRLAAASDVTAREMPTEGGRLIALERRGPRDEAACGTIPGTGLRPS